MIRKSRLILGILIITALALTIGNMVYPSATKIVLNVLWFASLSIAAVFIVMGIMAILGMKKEVGKLLEMFMEGSFSVLDLIDLIKQVFKLFMERVREILLNLAPLISYIISISLYLAALYLYKLVGKTYDVTILTIVISIIGIGLLSYLNLPGRNTLTKSGWRYEFLKRISKSFINSFEVVLFVFFLTMDSTHLFYVPSDLNVPLRAEAFGYNFMHRGFRLDSAKTTLIIIAAAVMLQVIRSVLKITYSARKYYLAWVVNDAENNLTERQRYQTIKKATRLSFAESKDDLVRFIAFTTALLLVFITFPRLKLLSLLVVNVTLLVFDLVFTTRLLTKEESEDLISVVLKKTLKI